MSDNHLWKRHLQDKINEYNRQHGRKPKGVSNKTMRDRATSLVRSFTLLRRLGYQMDCPTSRATCDTGDGMPADPYLSERLVATPMEAWA